MVGGDRMLSFGIFQFMIKDMLSQLVDLRHRHSRYVGAMECLALEVAGGRIVPLCRSMLLLCCSSPPCDLSEGEKRKESPSFGFPPAVVTKDSPNG